MAEIDQDPPLKDSDQKNSVASVSSVRDPYKTLSGSVSSHPF